MHRFLFTIMLAAAFVTACKSSAPDPVAAAIEAAAMKDVTGDYNFRITSLEKIDSTTFRTEFEHRKDVFRLKQQTEEKLYWKYYGESKPKTAESHRQAMEKAKVNLDLMDYLENEMADRLDSVAYYDYVFSGYSETGEGRINYNNVYTAITPDFEVLTMTSNHRDLHKGTGRVIPGYVEGVSAELLEE
ncbi:MAG: hypothetical protein IKX60_08210 [Bacteroidales bacterium]|nr:hypothetical protein [Bacteroidales bacterium]